MGGGWAESVVAFYACQYDFLVGEGEGDDGGCREVGGEV